MNINLTMIGQLMMFAMFTWFCMKFVWPPIVAAMEERKKRIESGLIAAERGLSEHKEAQQKAQELLEKSKNQASEIIANATKQASSVVKSYSVCDKFFSMLWCALASTSLSKTAFTPCITKSDTWSFSSLRTR
jgi:F0F1-type ATP synthase membrane subunit b/b'